MVLFYVFIYVSLTMVKNKKKGCILISKCSLLSKKHLLEKCFDIS